MKKVLFLSPLPPPDYGSAMSSKACLDILKGSNDFEVHSIKLNYSKQISDIGRINLQKLLGLMRVKRQIKEEFSKFHPEVVYFVPATSGFGLIRDYLFVKQVKKSFKGNILFHVRSRILEDDWRNKKNNKILRDMFLNSKVIVLGNVLKKDLHGIVEDKDLFVLPNAVENEISDKEFNDILKDRKKIKDPEILFLSNMDETKGWLKVLESCKILKERSTKAHFSFVGEWPSDKESKKFFKFLDDNSLKESVSYLGKKTGPEKDSILKNSGILVFPTEYPLETFGRVIIEAMMFGIPVIANGIATIPDIIDDKKTGFILEKNTPEEIAEKIEILLKDKRLREQMGKAGRNKFLERYTLKDYSGKFLQIFNQI